MLNQLDEVLYYLSKNDSEKKIDPSVKQGKIFHLTLRQPG